MLWVAPWGRPLAEVFALGLRSNGHEVLLVTSGRHHEAAAVNTDVFVVKGSLKQPTAWGSVAAAFRVARAFRPDVVVTEELTDPRLYPLLRLAPVAVLAHDDVPHDETEVGPWHHRAVSGRVRKRADLLVTFSRFVADRIKHDGVRVATVPLPSEAPGALTPPLVPAPERRDVVVLGRINPYKDVPTTLAAWAKHVEGPGYGGDELIIIGDGNEADLSLPARCRWRRERFQFAEVLPILARAKAAVVHYRTASQSGVQVTAMQCGTTAVVSDAGGLQEYLPWGQLPVPVGDVAALARALDALADPVRAAAAGAVSREHHDQSYRQDVAATALASALQDMLAVP